MTDPGALHWVIYLARLPHLRPMGIFLVGGK